MAIPAEQNVEAADLAPEIGALAGRGEPGAAWLRRSPFVLQCLRRLNAKRPSRRDDACECTAQDRRQRVDRRVAENIEMHLRQVVVGETEPQDRTDADA